MEDRKCVIKAKEGYSSGTAMYVSELKDAKIYNFNEVPKYMDQKDIIFLDTQEGLELLVKEVVDVKESIMRAESKLNSLKNGEENLFNSYPEMINEYIRAHNRNTTITPMNNDKRSQIVEMILKKYSKKQ